MKEREGTSQWQVEGEKKGRSYRQERNDVGGHEDLGQPARPDGRVALAVDEADDAAQDHVDGSGEEGRADEDEEGLDDEVAAGEVGGLMGGEDSAYVADSLDWSWILLVVWLEGSPGMGLAMSGSGGWDGGRGQMVATYRCRPGRRG